MELATQAESQAIIYEIGIVSTGEDSVLLRRQPEGKRRSSRASSSDPKSWCDGSAYIPEMGLYAEFLRLLNGEQTERLGVTVG
jgi:hypothetical protein